MPSEFDLNFDEFSSELDAISEMAISPTAPGATAPTARSRIAAGNGATLLLAATFEEYIRQQVRSAFRQKIKHVSGIDDFPKKMASTVWRRSFESLARTPFEEIELNGREVNARVNATLSFCLEKQISADVGDSLSHNESNMRYGELNRLFNQIGLNGLAAKACGNANLMDFLGTDAPGKADALLQSKFEQFFRRRNEIAHAIQSANSSGPAELDQDIKLFRVFGQALTDTLREIFVSAAEAA